MIAVLATPSAPTVRPTIDDKLISEITRRIVAACQPSRVILFGSRAQADHRPDSDVDLFIEMESTEPRWKRRLRIEELFESRWWPMDVVVYTPAEVARRRGSGCSVVDEVENAGRVLYERPPL